MSFDAAIMYKKKNRFFKTIQLCEYCIIKIFKVKILGSIFLRPKKNNQCLEIEEIPAHIHEINLN